MGSIVGRLTPILLILVAETALASWIRTNQFQVDPSEAVVDSLPPAAPILGVRGVVPGRPRKPGESAGYPYCDPSAPYHSGRIRLEVIPPEDDRTPDLKLGYIFDLVAGEIPDGLEFPTDPQRSSWTKWPVIASDEPLFVAPLNLVWLGGETWPAFSCSLRIAAIDLGGNIGPFSNTVLVEYRDDDSATSR